MWITDLLPGDQCNQMLFAGQNRIGMNPAWAARKHWPKGLLELFRSDKVLLLNTNGFSRIVYGIVAHKKHIVLGEVQIMLWGAFI